LEKSSIRWTVKFTDYFKQSMSSTHYASVTHTEIMVNIEAYLRLKKKLEEQKVTLVAVSKTHPLVAIEKLYHEGHRDFGENRVAELLEKAPHLPKDIRWHFIGNLQSKKVKELIPLPYLIHSVDRRKLLDTIQKEAEKTDAKVNILIQLKIASEETKSGFDLNEASKVIEEIIDGKYPNIVLHGLMAMATFTDDKAIIDKEFTAIERFFLAEKQKSAVHQSSLQILSIGMSNDYELALRRSSNMVRIGSLIFGERNY